MGVPGRTPGTMFAPIPVSTVSYSPEIVGSKSQFFIGRDMCCKPFILTVMFLRLNYFMTELSIISLTCIVTWEVQHVTFFNVWFVILVLLDMSSTR